MPWALAVVLACAAWSVFFVPTAGAQLGGFGQADAWPEVVVRFGWDGYVRPERVIPVEVELSGGTRAFSGLVVLRYRQDGSQRASVHAPAASTPGLVTRVRVLCVFPHNVDRVEVELVDLSGSQARVVRRAIADDSARSVGLPMSGVADVGLVLYTGRSAARSGVEGVGRAAPTQADHPMRRGRDPWGGRQTNVDTEAERWGLVRTARVEPDELAEAWAAYDGVEAMVIDAEAEISDAQTLAIRRWVQGGGRLIVLASGAGAGWQRFVPEGVALAPAASHTLPTGVRHAIDAQRLLDARTAHVGALAPGMRGGDEATVEASAAELAQREAALVEQVTARALRLAPERRDAGWRTVWDDPGEGGVAFGATGAMGFGRVLVLGVNPGSMPRTLDSELEGRLWRAAIGVVLDDWLSRPVGIDWSWQYRVTGSGADEVERQSYDLLLSRSATVRPVRWRVALAIGIGVLVLAMLVGPFDAIVLKRLGRRPWSWATAMGWTLVASAAAVSMPLVMRGETTRGDRMLVIDTLAPATGEVGLAWGEGVAGIYAGRSGVVALEAEGAAEDAALGTVWRGVSSLQSWMEPSRSGLGELPLFQREGAVLPGGIPVSVWSFRTLADHGELGATVIARVQGRGADAWDVELQGLPRQGIVRASMLRVGDQRLALDGDSVVDEHGRLLLVSKGPAADSLRDEFELNLMAQIQAAARRGRWHQSTRDSAMGAPGAWRRSASIQSRAESGAWAVVYLMLHEMDADETWTGDRASAFPGGWSVRWTVHRVVTPLHPVDRVPINRGADADGAAPEPEADAAEGGR